MTDRIIDRGILHHPDQKCRLFNSQIFRFFTKIDLCGRTDSDSIIEEIELVEIHLDYLFLGIETFELHRNHPFDRFLHRTGEHI